MSVYGNKITGNGRGGKGQVEMRYEVRGMKDEKKRMISKGGVWSGIKEKAPAEGLRINNVKKLKIII
jgi:hypothetical protein